MRPAWSIIIFTVLSGWGFGMITVLIFLSDVLLRQTLFASVVFAILLIVIGLASSVVHLANPKNAWRSLFRLRSSWLSREAVLAMLFFPVLIFWSFLLIEESRWVTIWGGIVILFCMVTVFSTAMIYASLKPIQLWRHFITPINYLLLSLMSGLMTAVIIVGNKVEIESTGLIKWLCVVILCAMVGKGVHFFRAIKMGNVSNRQATNIRAAKVRLLDTGHTGKNFLTREFIYTPNRVAIFRTRFLMWGNAFLCPLIVSFGVWMLSWDYKLLWVAGISMLGGLLAERWLFFAEARHVVRLYYGDTVA